MIDNRNTKDIFIRNANIAALELFHNGMTIEQTIDGIPTDHPVPFYYHMANDEQFMKDFFVHYDGPCKVAQAEGNYDIAPKGSLKWDGISISTAELTNKFVRGTYNKEQIDDNGQKSVLAYSARLFTIPIKLTYSVDLFADNLNQAMRLGQEVIRFFYRNNVVNFSFEGQRIRGNVGIADDFSMEKEFKFTYENNQKPSTTFNFNIETYFPIFDKGTSIFKGDMLRLFKVRMQSEIGTTMDTLEVRDPKFKGDITI